MIDVLSSQQSAVTAFRKLHEDGCFVLPNPWDIGTAVFLQQLGYGALATTSAGFAFSRGLPDGVSAVPRDVMLGHIRDIVTATALPVNADYQNAYADDPIEVNSNVSLCIETGVAGLSVEDATGESTKPLYELNLAIERIRAAREAIEASGIPVVLTARCEAFLVGHEDPARVVIERLVAYAEAGADCLYAPGLATIHDIVSLVRSVAPKPVNVLVSTANADFTVTRLADLGVRRISVGSALARVAWGAFARAASDILTTGGFETFREAASFSQLNSLFDRKL